MTRIDCLSDVGGDVGYSRGDPGPALVVGRVPGRGRAPDRAYHSLLLYEQGQGETSGDEQGPFLVPGRLPGPHASVLWSGVVFFVVV